MRIITILSLLLVSITAFAQHAFIRTDTIKVHNNSGLLQNPWAGGVNFAQFSATDLNFDNKKDLLVFDRAGNRISCFINNGATGQTLYQYNPNLTYKFPKLQFWALLRDFNNDGKEDIFTSSNGGVTVYKNTSTQANGVQFTLYKEFLLSNYQPNILTLYVSPADIPAVYDIDKDGDMDILTFSVVGSCVEYHQNQSMQLYGVPDSMVFKMQTDNWGIFFENSTNNSVTLDDTCDNPEHLIYWPEGDNMRDIEPGGEPERHIGSTLATLDMEGDGDEDLFIGDVSFTNIVHLVNGGNNTLAHITSVDLNFPSYDNSVNVELFPGVYFVDVNNDEKPDMIASPNTTLNGENFIGVHQYNNIGGSPPHTFDFIRKDFLQGDMIDVGEYALPAFFDYNNDGLKDLVVGNSGYFQGGAYKGGLALFKNIGTATNPEFKLMHRDWNSLSLEGLNYTSPTFGDLDGDGKIDMVTGDRTGGLHFFKNIAPTTDTTYFTYVEAAFTGVDVGGYSMPSLFDLDNDGLLDLVVGEKNGTVSFFKNTGTTTNYIFSVTPQIDPLGQFEVADETVSNFGYSAPVVIDSAGTTQMIVGSERGNLFLFDNIDGNLNGAFNLKDSVYTGYNRFGTYAAPAVADINNDGYYDVVVGNIAGGLAMYMGTFASAVEETIKPSDIILYPNPATAQVTIMLPQNITHVAVSVIDIMGRLIQQQTIKGQNTFTINTQNLAQGVYSVSLQTGSSVVCKKLVIR